jgi:chaperonin GroEL
MKFMSKQILYQDSARKALGKGIDILTEAVSVTLGPKGRNVVLSKKFGSPQIVNDGVTIAKEIILSNHIQNIGASLIRQAAAKTNDIAGDGTTTATVLARAIVYQGMQSLSSGSNPMEIKKGIDKATKFVVNYIVNYSRPIVSYQDIVHVASISAGNDHDVGIMIANAIERVGREGIISLEEGKSTVTELEITEGLRFEKGFISPYFVTDPSKMEVQYENPYILLTDKKLTFVQQEVVPVLEQVARTGRPLLIIADDVEKEVLATIIVNKLKGVIDVVAVRAPGFGDRRKALLDDIGILTSATVVSDNIGLTLEAVNLKMLGQARKIIVGRDSTIIIAQANNLMVQNRCRQIKKQLELSTNNYEKEKLQERLAKLSGGVALIKIGAATETDMKNKKLRLEDAINSTRAAIEEGIVPGGGAMLVHVSQNLLHWSKINLINDELIGALIVAKSLVEPLKRIVKNAGFNGSVVAEKVVLGSFEIGYDASADLFVNMFDNGIVDPVKVTRCALQNAASIASMILTTECVVVNDINN